MRFGALNPGDKFVFASSCNPQSEEANGYNVNAYIKMRIPLFVPNSSAAPFTAVSCNDGMPLGVRDNDEVFRINK